ncbi:flagellar export chaperone FliS [Desulfovibrio sp. OttesenSCG-928-A18]|nr:flagellar export chaperone FliS [Desulfovibrio sp. OttesenSCG-928-A18]
MQLASQRYKQTQVTTTSQGDLLIMLYDAALKFLNQAKEGLAANNMAAKGIAISKALDIINELDCTLNKEKGGTLAENLHGLYTFCTGHLVKANIQKSATMIDDVLKVITGIRSAYAEIAPSPEAREAAAEAAANLHMAGSMPPRAHAGQISGGAQAPAPGAGVRMRNMYARAAEAAQGESTAREPGNSALDGKAPLPEAALGRGTDAAPADQAAQAPVAPGPAPARPAENSPGAASPEKAAAAPPVPPTGMGAGFANARGAQLYRKFAG